MDRADGLLQEYTHAVGDLAMKLHDNKPLKDEDLSLVEGRRRQIADEYRDLFTALESVEWVTNDAGLELCPCCDGMRDQGHGEFCEVGNALARARGES